MAIGDVTNKQLISQSLNTTANSCSYSNPATTCTSVLTNIIVSSISTGTVSRLVTIYKDGTASANERMNINIDPTGILYPKLAVIDTNIVLTGTQSIYAKVDAGTDINLEISGIQEQTS